MNYRQESFSFCSIREMPASERPREKMELLGAENLSDTELMCAVLGRGIKERPVQDIARQVLDIITENGGSNLRMEHFTAVPGLGKAQASLICASMELGRRLMHGHLRYLNTPQDVFSHIRHFGDRQQEHFISIMLNGALEIMDTAVVSIGLVNRTIVHPREVFSEAVRLRATSIIIAHNHPSGNLEPSPEDLEITQRIKAAGSILGIKLVDHIVFSSENYISMNEEGLFIF